MPLLEKRGLGKLHWSTNKIFFLLFLSHYRFLTNFDMGNTKMTSIFAHSIWILQKLSEIEAKLRLAGKIFGFLKTPFVPFIVLKTTVSIPRFQCKNRFEKRTALGRDIWEKPKWGCGLVWRAMFKNIFANILGEGGPFFKPIFALKPWDRDGRFEYNKRYKRSF